MADTGPGAQALIEKRKGNEHFVKGKFSEAIAHYTNALDLVADVKGFDPKQRSILYANRAECLIRLKRYSEAIPSCDDAVKYDSSNIKARFRRAKANEAMGRCKESLKDLQFVIKRDKSNRKALELMRTVQRRLGISTKHRGDKLLSYDPETDVSERDQDDIAKYNLLNHRKSNLEDDILEIAGELRGINDAVEAVEMLLDEDACRRQLGQCFVPISNEDTEEFLHVQSKALSAKSRALRSELGDTIDEMTALRAKLKAKFGDHIGLPEIERNPKIQR